MTQIDITKPLELSDGTPCRYNERTPDYAFEEGWIDVCWNENGKNLRSNFMLKDGSSRCSIDRRTLRNVKESEVRTGLEHVERMEALLRRMAGAGNVSEMTKEAREIVAELDALNGDRKAAREVVASHLPLEAENFVSGECDEGDFVKIAELGIAKGRELEAERLDKYVDWNMVDIDADRAKAKPHSGDHRFAG